MASRTPPIDRRDATDIVRQVQGLLRTYVPEWREFDPQTGQATGISAALIGVFARYAEIIIQRLNHVPEKNFLAFLDLLGASLLPPQPARVPLTFFLTDGSVADGIVPAGTQVAAPPAAGEKEPVIFETERELLVTAAQLGAIFSRAPGQDRYADFGSLASATLQEGVLPFRGTHNIEHLFYIGHDALFAHPALKRLRLIFDVKELQSPDARLLRWEMWNGEQGVQLQPADATANLTRDGDVVFTNLQPVPRSTVHTLSNRWLRCRLLTPITPGVERLDERVRAGHLPVVNALTMEAELGRSGLGVERAFSNLLPVDMSKDFFPFGEKPRLSDTLYLRHDEAFSTAGARVVLNIALTNTDPAKSPPPAQGFAGLTLKWEFWNGSSWADLSASPGFQDSTAAFTARTPGVVSFIFPSQPARTTVNGAEGYWIRVRIASGNYGEEAGYVEVERTVDNKTVKGYELRLATFRPPSISAVRLDYSVTKSAQPEAVVTYNDFLYERLADLSKPFAPFQPAKQTGPSIYFGFTLPAARKTFPNRALNLYLRLAELIHGTPPVNPSPTSAPRVVWEYWNGQGWSLLAVRDGTEALTRTGLVEFLAPANFTTSREFGVERYWMRARWESGDYKFPPRVRRVLLNTTMASQTLTVRDEILGSSDASEGQKFRTTRAPVLLGQQVEVREPELPPVSEQSVIGTEEGPDAINPVRDETGRAREVWVRWHEVPDFYGSGPRDRHYVIDHLTGEVRFGDGLSGMIPPRGAGNLRASRYQTGGGRTGNKPVDTIVQLKTTVPYVARVTNTEAAAGGADAETYASLLQRAPRLIRHRDRAVTMEDYEDLAMMASPEVARVKSVPLYDLLNDPEAAQLRLGAVSLIIVPYSVEAKPLPSLELIERVQSFIDERRSAVADVAVVGPRYVRVEVDVEIALTSLERASEVEAAVVRHLSDFLHPLTGGINKTGWSFGRKPYRSDLYSVIESVPGVDHVSRLRLISTDDRTGREIKWDEAAGTGETDLFLVYSGTHRISLIVEEA